MLAPLAFLLAVQTPQDRTRPVPMTDAEVVAALAAAGYPATVGMGGRKPDTIARRRSAAEFTTNGRFRDVTLYGQIDVPQDVDGVALREWVRSTVGRRSFAAGANLGPTVDLRESVRIADGSTPADLEASLDGFFDAAEAVAKHVGGGAVAVPRLNWNLPEGTVAHTASLPSLERAFGPWRWLVGRREAAVANGGWAESLRVGGRQVWMRSANVDGRSSETAFEVVALDPKDAGTPVAFREQVPGDPRTRMAGSDYAAHPEDIVIQNRWHAPTARITLDLAAGMALGEIRRRIEAFAQASGYPDPHTLPGR